VRAIPIDTFFEDLDEQRRGSAVSAGSLDWARLVTEGRAARATADGGRWRIGGLALLVERRYAGGALQRFAEEIGESYGSVRRYRWVAKAYDPNARARFSTLSFSHFQAVAGLPDKLVWLERAERGTWSVDRLTRESRKAPSKATKKTASIPSDVALGRLRSSIDKIFELIAPASLADDVAISEAGKEWLAEALDELAEEIGRLRERVNSATRTAAAVKTTKVARIRKTPAPPKGKRSATDRTKSRQTALKARAIAR
jgi:hypothetical protein